MEMLAPLANWLTSYANLFEQSGRGLVVCTETYECSIGLLD